MNRIARHFAATISSGPTLMLGFAWRKIVVSIAVLILIISACNPRKRNDERPFAALSSSQLASNYGYSFWKDQCRRTTELWQRAAIFCSQPDHKFLANCQPVLTVRGLHKSTEALKTALDRYYLDNGNFPTTEQGLAALIEKPTVPPIPDGYPDGGYVGNFDTDLFSYRSDGKNYNLRVR